MYSEEKALTDDKQFYIDYFNHIYLDPRTGEIIPYYAEDTNSWLVYNSVEHLLKKQGLEDMEKGA